MEENKAAVEEGQIIPGSESPTPPAVIEVGGSMLNEKFVETAGKQIELRQKLLMTGLKALKVHDFQDFDGKPYLEGEGAARIMAVVRGFKVGEAKFTVENMTPHYFIECAIPMEFMGATTVAIGDCSTADPFFTGRDGQSGQYKRHLDRTGSEQMAARLILGDAKKKSRENAISRGVSELLGIKGLTWEDLAALGFSRTKAGSSVTFKKGSSGAEAKNLTVTEAIKSAKGSVINVSGTLQDAKERDVKKKDGSTGSVTDYIFADDKNKMKISAWGKCIESLKAGDKVFAAEVSVGEYQGSAQYTAKEISVITE